VSHVKATLYKLISINTEVKSPSQDGIGCERKMPSKNKLMSNDVCQAVRACRSLYS